MAGYLECNEELADRIRLKSNSQLYELFQQKEVEDSMLDFIDVLNKAGLTEGNIKDNPADWLHLMTELEENWHEELHALLINKKYKLQVLLRVNGFGKDSFDVMISAAHVCSVWTLRHGKHTLMSTLFPSTVFFVDDLMYNLRMRSHTYTRLLVTDKGDHYRTDLYEALNSYYMTRYDAEDDTFFIEDRIGAVIQKAPETVLCVLFLTNKLSLEDAIAYPGKHVAEYICSQEDDASTIEDDPVAIKQKYLQLIKNSNAFKTFIKTYYLSLYQ